MQHLANIVESADSSPGVQFRNGTYGKSGIREFLRDVVAMANAPVEGPRFIFTGCTGAEPGVRRISGIDAPAEQMAVDWRKLVSEYIEPPIRLRYDTIEVAGESVGVYQIGDCQDRPYMMRIDHCETLRRGDAYMRVNDRAVKLGRRQLQGLFEEKFRDSVSAETIEVGFAGEVLLKDLSLGTSDLGLLPSRVASAKLRELAAARQGGHGATTRLVRLTHARLFGAESPYEDRSAEEIDAELRAIGDRYSDADNKFIYTEAAHSVQLVVLNQGDEALLDASLKISLPAHEAIHVALRPPQDCPDDTLGFVADVADTQYPVVTVGKKAISVVAHIGDIMPGEVCEAFANELRLCAEHDLAGKRVGLDYMLHARNLRAPSRGRLRLCFEARQDSPGLSIPA